MKYILFLFAGFVRVPSSNFLFTCCNEQGQYSGMMLLELFVLAEKMKITKPSLRCIASHNAVCKTISYNDFALSDIFLLNKLVQKSLEISQVNCFESAKPSMSTQKERTVQPFYSSLSCIAVLATN